jgi:hypothetical protein
MALYNAAQQAKLQMVRQCTIAEKPQLEAVVTALDGRGGRHERHAPGAAQPLQAALDAGNRFEDGPPDTTRRAGPAPAQP